ncbi:hypothetical protein SKAU_G00311120 [Synaphobranchus kaupii]|uniref:Uncharacterized protein n=1 Tax=Synaphobranchus kaupii TaxID=118154 RepID=A0A9Q1IL24_SYNKA|nr:hypothetical protein SKAU_G00311120 [Synaphobranchus kaupii]
MVLRIPAHTRARLPASQGPGLIGVELGYHQEQGEQALESVSFSAAGAGATVGVTGDGMMNSSTRKPADSLAERHSPSTTPLSRHCAGLPLQLAAVNAPPISSDFIPTALWWRHTGRGAGVGSVREEGTAAAWERLSLRP